MRLLFKIFSYVYPSLSPPPSHSSVEQEAPSEKSSEESETYTPSADCGDWQRRSRKGEHLGDRVKVRFNGVRVPIDREQGAFVVDVRNEGDLKLGVFEMVFIRDGVFTNEVMGYCCKRIEGFAQKKQGTYFLPIVQRHEIMEEFLTRASERQRKNIGVFLSVKVKGRLSRDAGVEKKEVKAESEDFITGVPYLGKMIRRVAGTEMADKINELKALFSMVFRDIKDVGELLYGSLEIRKYYDKKKGREFREVERLERAVAAQYPRSSGGLFSFFAKLFWADGAGEKRRDGIRETLRKKLRENDKKEKEYRWHIKDPSFYRHLLLNYRYALASYGSNFIRLHFIIASIKNAIENCKCEQCHEKIGKPETTTFHCFTGIPYASILKQENNSTTSVFFVDGSNTLCIAFKGTLYGSDALLDLDCRYTRHNGHYVHNGILRESRLFIRRHKKFILETVKSRKICKIRFVGQSLGGALATLICILCKEDPDFNHLKISSVSFSSPPIMTKVHLINRDKRFINGDSDNNIITVSYGNDVVPSLSLASVLELRVITHHLYSIRIGRYLNKGMYIRNMLRALRKRGVEKLYTPGVHYQLSNYHGAEVSVTVIRKSNWREFSSLRLAEGMFIHHYPTTLIKALEGITLNDGEEQLTL